MIAEWAQYLGGGLLIVASLFSALAALGMLRFPDVYTRLHAASKAGALGLGLVFLAVAVVSLDIAVAVRALLGLFFILATAPVSAHLLARAALRSGPRPTEKTSISPRFLDR